MDESEFDDMDLTTPVSSLKKDPRSNSPNFKNQNSSSDNDKNL